VPAVPPPAAPILVLDAAAPTVVVGLQANANAEPVWRESGEEAGIALSRLADELLREHGLTIADLRTAVWCEGPGSLLGIRLAAMMLRTWMTLPRPTPLRVLGYRSLALLAADLLASGASPPFAVCNDARRHTWNVLQVAADGTLGDIRRCAHDELAALSVPLHHPESFPHWQSLPASIRPAPYSPSHVLTLGQRFQLWRETSAPDAFMTELPTYRTWSPAHS
jgi:tRNA threonylcarbamoyladenosine biosynthesis protein TsaB